MLSYMLCFEFILDDPTPVRSSDLEEFPNGNMGRGLNMCVFACVRFIQAEYVDNC